MEEMAVIVLAFLARLDARAPGSLTVFLHLHESSAADTAAVASIKHLASVPTRKEDGLERVARVLGELEPPLVVARAGVSCVQDRLDRTWEISTPGSNPSDGCIVTLQKYEFETLTLEKKIKIQKVRYLGEDFRDSTTRIQKLFSLQVSEVVQTRRSHVLADF